MVFAVAAVRLLLGAALVFVLAVALLAVLVDVALAAVVREGYAHVPGGDDRLKEGDTAVILVSDDSLEETVHQFGSAK